MHVSQHQCSYISTHNSSTFQSLTKIVLLFYFLVWVAEIVIVAIVVVEVVVLVVVVLVV